MYIRMYVCTMYIRDDQSPSEIKSVLLKEANRYTWTIRSRPKKNTCARRTHTHYSRGDSTNVATQPWNKTWRNKWKDRNLIGVFVWWRYKKRKKKYNGKKTVRKRVIKDVLISLITKSEKLYFLVYSRLLFFIIIIFVFLFLSFWRKREMNRRCFSTVYNVDSNYCHEILRWRKRRYSLHLMDKVVSLLLLLNFVRSLENDITWLLACLDLLKTYCNNLEI